MAVHAAYPIAAARPPPGANVGLQIAVRLLSHRRSSASAFPGAYETRRAEASAVLQAANHSESRASLISSWAVVR